MPKPWIEIIHFPFHIQTGEILKESVLSPTLDKSENKTEILAKSEIEPESTEKEESTLMKEIDTETLKEDSEYVNDGQENNLETLKEDSEYRNYTEEYYLIESDLNRINLGNPRVFKI